MKYRNHARVRAATRAGEPVPPCARARSGSHAFPPLADQPAMSSPSVVSCTLVATQTILVFFSPLRTMQTNFCLSVSSRCSCLRSGTLGKKLEKANVRLRMQTYDFRGKRAVTGTTKKIIPLTFPAPRAVVGL